MNNFFIELIEENNNDWKFGLYDLSNKLICSVHIYAPNYDIAYKRAKEKML